MDPVLPNIISGPAVLIHNEYSYYSEQGFKLDFQRDSFDVVSNMHGVVDTRLKSDRMKISWKPDGQIININKYFPYQPSHVGDSIFGKAAGGDTVVIQTKAGKRYTWQRGAITKLPKLSLCPTVPLLGDMEITCIGKTLTTQRTDAAFWKTAADQAFADTTWDDTKIITAVYKAAYGAAPYDAIGSMAGFEIEIAMDTKEITAVDVGIADIRLKGLKAMARFAPSNLTEAQIDTLLAMQGADAIQIGQSFARSDTDLVISSDVFQATIYKAGPVGYSMLYEATEHQLQGVEFASKRKFTAGVAQPLWLFEVL
jgi:hypothetical protein